jgi:hypothetical protein
MLLQGEVGVAANEEISINARNSHIFSPRLNGMVFNVFEPSHGFRYTQD